MAGRYPIGRLWTEAKIVKDRINAKSAQDALLMQAAIGSILDEKAAKHFKELIGKIQDGD